MQGQARYSIVAFTYQTTNLITEGDVCVAKKSIYQITLIFTTAYSVYLTSFPLFYLTIFKDLAQE